MKFTSPTNEDIQINLDNGYSGTVFAGRYEELHPMFHREALMAGAIVEGLEDSLTASSPDGSTEIGRADAIISALREMVESGNPDDFTQSGQPKIGKVRELVGLGIDREEMMSAWMIVSSENAE